MAWSKPKIRMGKRRGRIKGINTTDFKLGALSAKLFGIKLTRREKKVCAEFAQGNG